MPNWCSNTLTLTHDEPAMIKRVEASFTEGRLLEEFVPMPEGADWYSHNIEHWGTKWDVGDKDGIHDLSENSISLYFDSAWAPPVSAYKKLEEMGFTVRAMYHEPGMAFAGIYEDGCDDYYEFNDSSVQEVREQLPKELDEAFGITEWMEDINENSEE